MMTFTPFFATDVKTLDATPTIPLIPDPMSAIIETSTVTSTFFIILPSRFISSVFTALSRSFFFTMTEMLDSDGLWEIIIMLTPAFARTEKIVAAVPGAPTMLPPLTSINPVCLIVLTHLTVFLVSACGVAGTSGAWVFFVYGLPILRRLFFSANRFTALVLEDFLARS